jgi:hypothetical protein
VFPARYEPNFHILFGENSVFNGLHMSATPIRSPATAPVTLNDTCPEEAVGSHA